MPHALPTPASGPGCPGHQARWPPGAVTLQRLSGLSPDMPCAVSACRFPAGTFLHPLTLLTFVPTVNERGSAERAYLGTSPTASRASRPTHRSRFWLTEQSPGCPLTSSVVGQRIILQMLQLVKNTIPNKPQDDVRNGDIFQGKPFSSFLYLPKDDLVA